MRFLEQGIDKEAFEALMPSSSFLAKLLENWMILLYWAASFVANLFVLQEKIHSIFLTIKRKYFFWSQWQKLFVIWKNFLCKKERFDSAGYRARDLSIAGRMLYHLSYGSSTQLFSQNLWEWGINNTVSDTLS